MNRNIETRNPQAAVYVGPPGGAEFLDPVLFANTDKARKYARRLKRRGMHARLITDKPLRRSFGGELRKS